MRGMVGKKLEMAARVRGFNRIHPSTDPEYATVLGRFEELLGRAEKIAGRQLNGLAAATSARTRRKELRKAIHSQLLPYLVTIGGIAATTRTELATRFRLPDSHGSHRAFLLSVRDMLALAEQHKDALVADGMAPRLLDELNGMLAEFEAVTEAARSARLDHIGARADMTEVLSDLLKQVKALDAINRWRFGKDPELLVEWKAAKQMPHRFNGKANGNGGTPPITGGPTPEQ